MQEQNSQGSGRLRGSVEGVLGGDLPTRVFEELFSQIIGGTLRSGDRLPSERALTEHFGVNRQVVREALKRLAQLGLIVSDRGNGNLVGDWRRTGSFDLLPLLIARALGEKGPEPLLVARHLLEVRLSFALSVSQLCIVHASDGQLEELVEAAVGVRRYPDVTQRFTAEWRVWSIATEASGNIAYTLLLNSLRNGAGPALLLMARASRTVPGDPDDLLAATRAVAARDQSETEVAVRHLYRIEPTDGLRAAEEQVSVRG